MVLNYYDKQVIETKKDSTSSRNNTTSKLDEITEESTGRNPFSALDNLENESSKIHSSAPTSKTSLQEVNKTSSDHANPTPMVTTQEKCSIQRSQSGPNRKLNVHQKTIMRKLALQLQSLENKQYVVNNGNKTIFIRFES